jgi:hypothetical protein
MTRIADYHRRVDADRQAKKAELDPSRVQGLPVAPTPTPTPKAVAPAAAPVRKAKKGKKAK